MLLLMGRAASYAAPIAACGTLNVSAYGPGSEAGVPVGAPIMILDELDSGVGSRLGQPVAAMLRRMAAPVSDATGSPGTATQILCVSHIPQACTFALYWAECWTYIVLSLVTRCVLMSR